MHFLIDVKENTNILEVPYPYVYEGKKGFVVIDYNGNCLFINSTTFENVEHLFDNAFSEDTTPIEEGGNTGGTGGTGGSGTGGGTEPDKCDNELKFTLIESKIVGQFNEFTVGVTGNKDVLVEYKSDLDVWKKASFLDKFTVTVQSSGLLEGFRARITGCTQEYLGAFKSSTLPTTSTEEEVGIITFSPTEVHKLILKVVENQTWLLQTDSTRSYYVPRGKNVLTNSRTTLYKTVNKDILSNDATTAIDGLYPSASSDVNPPSSWPYSWWAGQGYVINNRAEWKKVAAGGGSGGSGGSGGGNTTLIVPPIITYPKDIVLSYWLQDCNDFRNCDEINPYYPNCNPFGYNVNGQSNGAKARLKHYKFKHLTKPPFYAEYHPVKHISDGNGNSGDTDFNIRFTQEAFDKCLEYAYECGAKAFDFYFYDNDTDVSEHIRYNQTTVSPYKDFVKYYYTLGSLGFNAKPTMDRIVSHMSQSRYYRVDNKPVLLIDTPENSLFHVDRYVLPSGATFHEPEEGYPDGYYLGNSDYTGPIKFAPENGYIRASGNTPYHVMVEYIKSQYSTLHGGNLYLIKQGGYWYHNGTNIPEINEDAVTNYLAISSGDTLNNHSYNLITDDNIASVTNVLTSTNNNIVPTIAMGFNNVGDAGGAGQVPSNTNTASTAEVIDHFNKVKTLCNIYPSKIPFVKIYSFGETDECGGGAVVPRKNPDGTIDKSKVLAIREAVSN